MTTKEVDGDPIQPGSRVCPREGAGCRHRTPLLSSMGLLFSVHTSAKVVYSFLLMVGIASAATGYRKRRAT
jgi:hypothetical protein